MYRINLKKKLAPGIILMDIEAPRVAKSALPGQFVIVRINDKGERVPLTICDYDLEKGTVTIVVQAIGDSTNKIAELNEGDYFADFAGPLGQPSEFVHENVEDLKKKNIIFIAGGVGTAPVYPQVKWLSQSGINVDVIIGGKSKEYIIFEDEMRALGAEVHICTDDGSYGYKGLVTNKLKELVSSGKHYDTAIAIGPLIMMKFVCLLTKELKMKTIVSLNALMVDATGMCGACRVTVGGEVKFTCVDGPEFDGHLVDFDQALRRQTLYKSEEFKKVHRAKHGSDCECLPTGGVN